VRILVDGQRFSAGARPALVLGALFAALTLFGVGSSAQADGVNEPAIGHLVELRSALPLDDIDGRLKLASLASEHGWDDQADELLREILMLNPDHELAYHQLWTLAAERRISTESDSLQEARNALSNDFKEYESRRFVVLSDVSTSLAQSQLALLERANHQLHRFTAQLDLKPLPLRHKLVCILFNDERDYRVFGREHDDVIDERVTGYYSPRHDWVVFYSAQSNPQVVEARKRLDQFSDDVQDMSEQVDLAVRQGHRDQAESLRAALMQSQEHLATQRQRIDDYARRETMVTTIHEAVHQMLFLTGVQARRVRYPLWICEGLATCFETQTPSRPFGPDHDYAPRRSRFQELLDSGSLMPLRELVAIENTNDEDAADVIYQQSYALVMWMSRYRKEQLRDYLTTMLRQPEAASDSNQHLQIFEQVFGSIEALERNWLRHEKRLLKEAHESVQANQ
jgi:hypothetical protein